MLSHHNHLYLLKLNGLPDPFDFHHLSYPAKFIAPPESDIFQILPTSGPSDFLTLPLFLQQFQAVNFRQRSRFFFYFPLGHRRHISAVRAGTLCRHPHLITFRTLMHRYFPYPFLFRFTVQRPFLQRIRKAMTETVSHMVNNNGHLGRIIRIGTKRTHRLLDKQCQGRCRPRQNHRFHPPVRQTLLPKDPHCIEHGVFCGGNRK